MPALATRGLRFVYRHVLAGADVFLVFVLGLGLGRRRARR